MKASLLIMAGRVLTFVAVGGISLLAQAPPSDATPAVSKLISNGDFQTATHDATWPDDWPKGKGLTWETEGGKHFLRLVAQEPGKMLMAYREVDIPTGTQKLEVTIKYRTSGIVVGAQNFMDARAIFHFLNTAKKNIPPDPAALSFSKEASDWTTVTEQFAVPVGALKLVVLPTLFQVSSGTLDLGSVSVTSVGP
jgi:hypothetical protein